MVFFFRIPRHHPNLLSFVNPSEGYLLFMRKRLVGMQVWLHIVPSHLFLDNVGGISMQFVCIVSTDAYLFCVTFALLNSKQEK